jgi:hypothetical protein
MPLCYRATGVVRPLLSGFSIERTIGWAGAIDAEYLLDDMPLLLQAIEQRLSMPT